MKLYNSVKVQVRTKQNETSRCAVQRHQNNWVTFLITIRIVQHDLNYSVFYCYFFIFSKVQIKCVFRLCSCHGFNYSCRKLEIIVQPSLKHKEVENTETYYLNKLNIVKRKMGIKLLFKERKERFDVLHFNVHVSKTYKFATFSLITIFSHFPIISGDF